MRMLCYVHSFVMFAFHYDLVCYVYGLSCLCSVVFMFRYVMFGYVYGLLCFAVLCLCLVMFMFCYVYVFVYVPNFETFLHLAEEGIKNMLYANILEKEIQSILLLTFAL